MNRLLRVFFDTDLRCGHLGLTKIARDNKVYFEKLSPGEFTLFINRSQTSFKLFASTNVLAYYKGTRRIDMDVIKHVPTVFNGSEINYDAALKKMLENKLLR